MAKVCLYFQIHQPWRLRKLGLFDTYNKNGYFDNGNNPPFDNGTVMNKLTEKCYRPMLSLLTRLITDNEKFRFSLSITGTAIEQMLEYSPDLVDLIGSLVDSERVELLSETYYHSLSGLYSRKEFYRQIKLHTELLKSNFGVVPRVFRNTELIYTNEIAKCIQELGYSGMLVEGADKILRGRRPTSVYRSPGGLPLLLKHYMLSDDVAFRFSESSRLDKPLTADTYSHWINSSFGGNELVNLFMDFETFGEHQWIDTGIFDFFDHFVHVICQSESTFVTVSDAIAVPSQNEVYFSDEPVSWADTDRDITAWRGNAMQEDSLRAIYSLEEEIINSNNNELIDDWSKLQTSDHFYYMCTKWANDGDVHAYFSPYKSPFAAYNNYNFACSDLKGRLINMNNHG